MIDRKYADFAWEQAAALLAVESSTGFNKTFQRNQDLEFLVHILKDT